jgi:hypothetical protein
VICWAAEVGEYASREGEGSSLYVFKILLGTLLKTRMLLDSFRLFYCVDVELGLLHYLLTAH